MRKKPIVIFLLFLLIASFILAFGELGGNIPGLTNKYRLECVVRIYNPPALDAYINEHNTGCQASKNSLFSIWDYILPSEFVQDEIIVRVEAQGISKDKKVTVSENSIKDATVILRGLKSGSTQIRIDIIENNNIRDTTYRQLTIGGGMK